MPAIQPAAGDAFPGGGSDDSWPAPGPSANALSGSPLDDLGYPGWRAGDPVNGQGLLRIVPPPANDDAAQAARTSIDQYVAQGITQRLLGPAPAARAPGPWAAPTPQAANPSAAPATSAGDPFWSHAVSGYANDFKDLIGNVGKAVQARVDDPIGSALNDAWATTPIGQAQLIDRMGQQATSDIAGLARGYQDASRGGTLPAFWGDLVGHGAAKATQAIAASAIGGVGDLAFGSAELAPEALEAGVPETVIQRGGAYRDVRGVPGYEAHHMPADSISPLPTAEGPAIAVTKADHQLTMSWGSRQGADAYRQKQADLIQNGDFGAAQQMDIDDIRKTFGSKYDDAIRQLRSYTDSKIQK